MSSPKFQRGDQVTLVLSQRYHHGTHAECVFAVARVSTSLGQFVYAIRCTTCPAEAPREATYAGVFEGHLRLHAPRVPAFVTIGGGRRRLYYA